MFIRRNIRSNLDLLKPTGGDPVTNSTTPNEILIRSFDVGDHVYVLDVRPTATHKWIPGTVSQALGGVHYMVNVNGTLWKRHVDQIRRNFAPELQSASSTPESLFDGDDGLTEDDSALEVMDSTAETERVQGSILHPTAEDNTFDTDEGSQDESESTTDDVAIETPPPPEPRNTVPSHQPAATVSVPTTARRSGRTRTVPPRLRDFVPTVDFRKS
jgi:hypothetical protein